MTTNVRRKDIVRRLFEGVINEDRPAVANEFVAPGFINHDDAAGPAGDLTGPAAFTAGARTLKAPCPDFQVRVEDLLAEDDRVIVRWSGRGTHTGAFRGQPPTGRAITNRGIHIFRFEGEQVVEMWPMMDRLGVLQQLGILPQLPAPQPAR